MAQIQGATRPNTSESIDIQCDVDGNLFVRATNDDHVQQGDIFLDGSVVFPLVPTTGPLVFAVDPSNVIQPLEVNAAGALKVDATLDIDTIQKGDTINGASEGLLGFGEITSTGLAQNFQMNNLGHLFVDITPPLPVSGTPNDRLLYVKYFDTGVANVNPVDLKVDGSVTPVVYDVKAEAGGDVYITKIQILIVDEAVSLNKFGNISPLANGLDLELLQAGSPLLIINKAKTCGELVAQSDANSLFGDSNTINILSNYLGNDDAMLLTVNLEEFYEGGVRLGVGNTDQFKIRVNDDLTDLTKITVRAIGYKVIS